MGTNDYKILLLIGDLINMKTNQTKTLVCKT